MTLEEIRQYWTLQARQHGMSPSASWSDHSVIDMEVRKILEFLRDGDRVLDAGCANGYSTIQFASHRDISITGIDYVPGMIENARSRLQAFPSLRDRVIFDTGDIQRLDFPSGSFDKAVVIRVVINLGEWSNQAAAITECARVLKPGGVLLLSEATLQGWRKLNSFRAEWKLPDIPMPPFNNYLDEERVVTTASSSGLQLLELVNFASTYYVGTRVLKPLIAQSLASNIDVADPGMHWNEFFSKLPPAGDYGTQKLFVFEKR